MSQKVLLVTLLEPKTNQYCAFKLEQRFPKDLIDKYFDAAIRELKTDKLVWNMVCLDESPKGTNVQIGNYDREINEVVFKEMNKFLDEKNA